MGFKRGETEYVIAAVPLGGFVKMLGEQPADEASKSTDPRAYSNKSVGARMAIISAGVIMNVILGLGCFVYAYGHGMALIVPTAIRSGISCIGITSNEEARVCRAMRFRGRLLRLRTALPEEVEDALRAETTEPTSQQVGVAVLERLKVLDDVAYLRFASVYKGFEEAGDFEREAGLLTKTTEPKRK